jgi:hypothetical protein
MSSADCNADGFNTGNGSASMVPDSYPRSAGRSHPVPAALLGDAHHQSRLVDHCTPLPRENLLTNSEIVAVATFRE